METKNKKAAHLQCWIHIMDLVLIWLSKICIVFFIQGPWNKDPWNFVIDPSPDLVLNNFILFGMEY